MGRPTSDCTERLLTAKMQWLISHALERAAKDLGTNGKRSFARFVEDLDVHDRCAAAQRPYCALEASLHSFSKRIFELLVKETIQRRPRPVKQPSRERPTSPRHFRVPASPEPIDPLAPHSSGRRNARRFEMRMPFVSDMAGVPPSSATSRARRLEAEQEHGAYYAHARDGRFGPPNVNLGGHLDAAYPNWFERTDGPSVVDLQDLEEAARHRVATEMDATMSGTSSELPVPHRTDARPSLEATSPPTIQPARRAAIVTRARDDFEAFSARRRSRVRHESLDDASEPEDVYERLGSSSSVAALAGLEYSHASWDREAVRERNGSGGDGDMMSMQAFLAQNEPGADSTGFGRRIEATTSFEESDARAPM